MVRQWYGHNMGAWRRTAPEGRGGTIGQRARPERGGEGGAARGHMVSMDPNHGGTELCRALNLKSCATCDGGDVTSEVGPHVPRGACA